MSFFCSATLKILHDSNNNSRHNNKVISRYKSREKSIKSRLDAEDVRRQSCLFTERTPQVPPTLTSSFSYV